MINLQYLKAQRIRIGLSQKQVAEALGYATANGYWKLECGVTNLRAEHLALLSDILELDLDKIICSNGGNHNGI